MCIKEEVVGGLVSESPTQPEWVICLQEGASGHSRQVTCRVSSCCQQQDELSSTLTFSSDSRVFGREVDSLRLCFVPNNQKTKP